MELRGNNGPVVEGEDVKAVDAKDKLVSDQNGEGGLEGVVRQEEAASGGDVAPGATDGAVAEEGFGVEADEDLPNDDLVWEADDVTPLIPSYTNHTHKCVRSRSGTHGKISQL